jgi:hypothetical protein
MARLGTHPFYPRKRFLEAVSIGQSDLSPQIPAMPHHIFRVLLADACHLIDPVHNILTGLSRAVLLMTLLDAGLLHGIGVARL